MLSASFVFVMLASVALAQDLDAIVAKYKDAFAKQAEIEAKVVAPVHAAYLRELGKLRDNAKVKGDLDAAIEAEAALKAAEAGTAAPGAKKIGAAVTQARTNYQKARELALRTYASGRQRLEAEFVRAMTDLEQKYTRAGNLEAAKEVRDRRANADFVSGADVLSTMSGADELRDGMAVADKKWMTTAKSYAPPVEITYVFMTTDQVRIGYAADQIILNWELNRNELRIDGGPATKQYVKGQGAIPKDAWVTVKQVVRSNEMELYVNGDRRARWAANFGAVNSPIRITGHRGVLTLKRVAVRRLAPGE